MDNTKQRIVADQLKDELIEELHEIEKLEQCDKVAHAKYHIHEAIEWLDIYVSSLN